jgi:hypothetical protein
MVRTPHIKGVTSPKNSKLKPVPTGPSWEAWEVGALDRGIDQLWAWRFYCAAEDASLDRLGELSARLSRRRNRCGGG